VCDLDDRQHRLVLAGSVGPAVDGFMQQCHCSGCRTFTSPASAPFYSQLCRVLQAPLDLADRHMCV
jgi:hypothetical protein